MATNLECVSCGNDVGDHESERDFCVDCDSQFTAGLVRADEIVARAEQLELAKNAGDVSTVQRIMGEIFAESVVM